VLNGAPQSMIGTADYLLEFSDGFRGAGCACCTARRATFCVARFSTAKGFPKTCGPVRTRSSRSRVGVEGRLASHLVRAFGMWPHPVPRLPRPPAPT
jgi:hypothetical protein